GRVDAARGLIARKTSASHCLFDQVRLVHTGSAIGWRPDVTASAGHPRAFTPHESSFQRVLSLIGALEYFVQLATLLFNRDSVLVGRLLQRVLRPVEPFKLAATGCRKISAIKTKPHFRDRQQLGLILVAQPHRFKRKPRNPIGMKTDQPV